MHRIRSLAGGERHDHYSLKDGFLLMHGKVCVLGPKRAKILEESHSPPYAGHRGIEATNKAMESFFYWPSLRKDVDTYVRSCIICQKMKYDR